MEVGSESPHVTLQALVAELLRDGSHLLPQFNNLLDAALQKTLDLNNGLEGENKSASSALENAAVLLWNKTVVMKSKGSLAATAIAKMRLVAFRMVICSCSSSKDELSLRKQILMGMKTSRAWIECQQFDQAEKLLDLVNQMTKALHTVVVQRCNEAGSRNEDCLAVEEDMLKLFCCKAEVFAGQKRYDEALQCIQMAKEFLSRFPAELNYMSMLCYNFGVSAYHDKQLKLCAVWLRESFDFGKENGCVDSINQARTLRFLANAYLEWNEPGCYEKALDAVTLANQMHLHPSGLFLKLRVMLKSKEIPSSTITGVLDVLMKHADTRAELCHSVILLLRQHAKDLGMCPLASSSLKRFQNSPDYGRLLVAYLDLLLCHDVNSACNFAKECIIAHNTDNPLDASSRKLFHLLFWEQAAQHFEKETFSDALNWYNYSLSLSPSGGGDASDGISTENLAKLHRNRASCYVSLHQLPQAREALDDAKKADPSSVHTHFLCFKVALKESDIETAKHSLQAMVDNISPQNLEESNNLICLSAQIAKEQNCESLAAVALSSIVSHSTDSYLVLKALRCLVRLSPEYTQHSTHDSSQLVGELLSYLQTARDKLLALTGADDNSQNQIQTEASWFMKTAWNMALKCADDPANMKEYFVLCSQFLSLCEQDEFIVSHQKSCLLMATASCIQMARSSASSEHEMNSLLDEAVHYITKYRSIEDKTCDTIISDKIKRPAQALLLLYEFEAFVKLGDAKAESILEKALVLPDPEPRFFESLAALAVASPARQFRLCLRALRAAIHTYLKSDEPDFVKCSKDVHQLIEQSLKCNEDEAFTYFTETINVLDKKAQGKYPQMETVWLMTKAWNTGIRHFCFRNYTEAERWCALSMRLLAHIGSLRDAYEDQMMSVYSDILEGMERQRSSESLEE